MLVALDDKGKTVNLLRDSPTKDKAFFCPACKAPLQLRSGQIIRPYFAHISRKTCRFYHENESAEHLSLKAELYRSLSRTEKVSVEQFLPDSGLIADLMVNHRLALEVQCSPLSSKRLKERTQAYLGADYQVLWLSGRRLWLGQSITELQKHFLCFSQNMGFHYWELDRKRQELRLKYLIYEDLHGKLHYLTKTCPFTDHLLDFLRLPFKAQPLVSYKVKMDSQLLFYIQKQLYFGHSGWRKRQEKAYLQGSNLLAKDLNDFYPQVRPFADSRRFCQIHQDLSDFRQAFFAYYRKQGAKKEQQLFPPAYYQKSKP
ncbi:competence protein CoiA [Streptococcus sp. H49]|uniref:competence protein CoiA n=1 Tax=Streptococcus huangxiaojuni TaxID=3237239 RepID=UPI0034A1E400